MNYFEFYNIPISFLPNQTALKRTFYKNSKKYHPDFYTLESDEKQAEILELSSLNNAAYQTLSNMDKRMKYVLGLKGVLAEEGKNKVPQDFLMDMMDINEALMELEFDFNATQFEKVQTQLKALEDGLNEQIRPILEQYRDEKNDLSALEQVKNFYLKKRYLLRIQENLSKFASL